ARKNFTTGDGVRLSYLEAGSGQPFVMIPGWSQTAVQWHNQIDHFAKTHRVIAVDMRGHGQSDKPDYGYRVYRLAQDVRELMVALDLRDAVLMGHSMGCSVIWAYYDLYGADRVAKLVLVDQSTFLSDHPNLSEDERVGLGAIFTPQATFETAAALGGDENGTVTAGFVGGMFCQGADPDLVAEAVELNLAFPRPHSGTLIIDHVHNDWQDVLPRIAVPTICIGGKSSLVPWRSVEWQASQIPGAKVDIFETEQGGAHFMFMENPERFNRVVAEFLDD
ncbi:MAG: alpha/beta hydrolase, partial [Pseudomonadota bacterium]